MQNALGLESVLVSQNPRLTGGSVGGLGTSVGSVVSQGANSSTQYIKLVQGQQELLSSFRATLHATAAVNNSQVELGDVYHQSQKPAHEVNVILPSDKPGGRSLEGVDDVPERILAMSRH